MLHCSYRLIISPEMVNESRHEYVCPMCHAGFAVDVGYCPECGYIGRLEHKVLRLTKLTAAGKLVIEGPPLRAEKKGIRKRPSEEVEAVEYMCPRCGLKVDKAFGRCTNNRHCGYTGPMRKLNARGEEAP